MGLLCHGKKLLDKDAAEDADAALEEGLCFTDEVRWGVMDTPWRVHQLLYFRGIRLGGVLVRRGKSLASFKDGLGFEGPGQLGSVRDPEFQAQT